MHACTCTDTYTHIYIIYIYTTRPRQLAALPSVRCACWVCIFVYVTVKVTRVCVYACFSLSLVIRRLFLSCGELASHMMAFHGSWDVYWWRCNMSISVCIVSYRIEFKISRTTISCEYCNYILTYDELNDRAACKIFKQEWNSKGFSKSNGKFCPFRPDWSIKWFETFVASNETHP